MMTGTRATDWGDGGHDANAGWGDDAHDDVVSDEDGNGDGAHDNAMA